MQKVVPFGMATLKIVLRKKANKDGTYPLCIRVIKDRKASYISIGHSIKESEWNAKDQQVKKSHPNSTRLNNLLLKKKAEANDRLLDLETKNDDSSSRVIREQIKPKTALTFFAQARIFTDNLKRNGKYNRYQTELGRVERFKEFLGRDDISFKEITVNLLNQFRAWLKANRGIKERTIVNYLMLIRTVYNQAIKSHVIDNKTYPFGKNGIVIKLPNSIKIGLTSDEVKKLESLQLEGYKRHALNLWLVSFYFAGMRLADVLTLRWSSFHDGRLYYAMNKNLKADSIKIPEKAWAIIEQYRNDPQKHDFVFPDLKVLDELEDHFEVQRKISFAGKRLEENLKEIAKDNEINKKLSMHISRHSFAQIAGDKISIQVLQELYRHSNITTTIAYQGNFVKEKTDNALDTVLSF